VVKQTGEIRALIGPNLMLDGLKINSVGCALMQAGTDPATVIHNLLSRFVLIHHQIMRGGYGYCAPD